MGYWRPENGEPGSIDIFWASSFSSSAFCLGSIATHIAKFSRTLDEPALALRTLFAAHPFVAQSINFPFRHFGSLAPTAAAAPVRGCCTRERSFHETEDCCFPSGQVSLSISPFIEPYEYFLIAPDRYGRDFGFHVRSSSGSPVTACAFGFST